jgi:hypothetical protein
MYYGLLLYSTSTVRRIGTSSTPPLAPAFSLYSMNDTTVGVILSSASASRLLASPHLSSSVRVPFVLPLSLSSPLPALHSTGTTRTRHLNRISYLG